MMTRSFPRCLAPAAVALATACVDNPTAVVSPDISIRAAKPVRPPASSITVTTLGTLAYTGDRRGEDGVAMALNNGVTRSATRVGGRTKYANNHLHPFTWTQGTGMSALAVIEARPGWVQGVSDNGTMVGEINTSAGTMPFIVTANGPMSYLSVPSGGTGRATGINADGSCVTGSVSDGNSALAVVWRNGVRETLGPGTAAGVTNDCLAVAGSTGSSAAIWRYVGGTWTVELLPARGPGSTFVGPLRYAEALDISPSGEYASGRRTDSASATAVVWQRTTSGWVVTDLPGGSGFAFGVDNNGRAVGGAPAGPVLWIPNSAGSYTAQVLPSLSRNTEGAAIAINELGQIVGRSRNRAGVQPVMWTLPSS